MVEPKAGLLSVRGKYSQQQKATQDRKVSSFEPSPKQYHTRSFAKAQEDNSRVITTGVPFLLIAADARSAGMADMGVATSADAFSQQYNPAKYAFSLQKQGFSVSYTPYLSSIANDISLGQITYYNRFRRGTC